MAKKKKREYQRKLTNRLFEHREFLSEKLKEEWEQLEKEARREKIVRQVKESGQTAVVVTAKIILALLAVGGVLTVGMIAPNIFGATGRLRKKNHFFNKKDFNKAKNYLKRQDYIKVKEDKGISEIEITDKGIGRTLRTAFCGLKVDMSKKWDGNWRIVMFDIPNRHKWAREGFREKIKEMGFYQIQESVFIMPYPCEEEIELLISLFSISSYTRLIKTPRFVSDNDIKDYFRL